MRQIALEAAVQALFASSHDREAKNSETAEISESGSIRRRMSADMKRKERIWEFFLKKCEDERQIEDLLITLPFPRENLDLRRVFMLRSLSLQASKGMIEERTLHILKGLGELGRAPATKKKRLPANFSCQEVAKRPNVLEYESKDDEATNSSSTPQMKDSIIGRLMPAQTIGGIRDSMKGRELSRNLGGGGDTALKALSKGNTEIVCADNAGIPDGSEDLPGNQFFSRDQSRKHCELELALMLELALKHVRADCRDRKKFEAAVTKHWGDSSNDSDGWHGAGIPGIARAREQIKIELWMVLRNQELLDGVVERYRKAKVADLLKIYLDKEWAAAGQTFLERVSADVMRDNYKPLNCNGQRSKKVARPGDGDAGQQSSGKLDTSEKPSIRAWRGRYSDTAIRREGCSHAEVAAPTTCPDTVSTLRNLRKQRVLDAVVQDPLPKIISSRSKGSLLEHNATTRNVEWEDYDDIEDSPSSSPSASRHVRLPHPTERKISPLVGSKASGTTNAKTGRRKPRRWSDKEVETFKREVGKYGKGQWKFILEKNLDIFQGRTEVDLKDKWRNLERYEGIVG
ncbi:unnamed protein product [Calypogeia fissa]